MINVTMVHTFCVRDGRFRKDLILFDLMYFQFDLIYWCIVNLLRLHHSFNTAFTNCESVLFSGWNLL